MKKFLGFLVLALGGVFGAQASPIWDVAICSGCTSNGQFEAAGRQAAGTGYNGERQILVINPSTKVSRHVLVMNVPPGEVPRSVEPPVSIQVGSAIALDHDPDASTYFAGAEREGDGVRHVMAGSTTSHSWGVSNTEQAEIGALIEFGSKDYVIVLPNSDLFSSFQHRNEPAVANKIYQAMTEKNPGWAVRSLGATFGSWSRTGSRCFSADLSKCVRYSTTAILHALRPMWPLQVWRTSLQARPKMPMATPLVQVAEVEVA